eukprot:scaffold117872_cov81-Phaeocystis_antarctica.AAC.1
MGTEQIAFTPLTGKCLSAAPGRFQRAYYRFAPITKGTQATTLPWLTPLYTGSNEFCALSSYLATAAQAAGDLALRTTQQPVSSARSLL